MAVKGRPREFDRDAALEVAMLALWQKGYSGTSTKKLCEVIGIGSPSLYAAFGNKEALYAEAIEQYVKSRGAPLWDEFLREGTARDAVKRLRRRRRQCPDRATGRLPARSRSEALATHGRTRWQRSRANCGWVASARRIRRFEFVCLLHQCVQIRTEQRFERAARVSLRMRRVRPNAVKVAGEAIQALGGAGYTKDWPVERYWRDAKLLDIGAGTNEVRRMLIGREVIGLDTPKAQ